MEEENIVTEEISELPGTEETINEVSAVYTIILGDGSTVGGLTKNGDNFISTGYIDPDIFEDNLYAVSISDGRVTEEHTAMELIQLKKMANGETWFILRDLSASKLENMRLNASIAYLEMRMGDEI